MQEVWNDQQSIAKLEQVHKRKAQELARHLRATGSENFGEWRFDPFTLQVTRREVG